MESDALKFSTLAFTPVFVVGAQRSGTTFLAELLGRAERVLTTPEAQFFKKLLCKPDKPMGSNPAEELVDNILSDFRFHTLGISIDREQLIEILIEIGPAKAMSHILETHSNSVGKNGFKYWVEHSPENITEIPWILNVLPQAKVIHIIRDGRGVLNSFRGLNWGPHSARKVADYWSASTLGGLALEIKYPDRVISVKYEDIIEDKITELSRLAQFVFGEDLAFDGKSFELPEFTRKQHSLVGANTDKSRVMAWEKNLSDYDVRVFNHFARVCLCHYGYMQPDSIEPFDYKIKDSAIDYLKDGLKLMMSKLRRSKSESKFVSTAQRSKMNQSDKHI